MTSPEIARAAGLALAFIAGGGAGLAHFTGLWLTVRSLAAMRRPAVVVAASALARLFVTAGVFAWLAHAGGWRWAVAGLAGFVVVRQVVVSRWGRARRLTVEPAP